MYFSIQDYGIPSLPASILGMFISFLCTCTLIKQEPELFAQSLIYVLGVL